MAETKYGKYIITEPKSNIATTDWGKEETASERMNRIFYLDDEVIKGAFYVECAWFVRASHEPAPEPHTHDFDEVLAFLGTNPDKPYDLGGEIEVWLDDEKHVLTKSCLVFIPKGLRHCPLVFRRVDRPIFHFATGSGGMYTGDKK
jgi:mannose-6-phosphate isomerase-like protein (cupin superfamily)